MSLRQLLGIAEDSSEANPTRAVGAVAVPAPEVLQQAQQPAQDEAKGAICEQGQFALIPSVNSSVGHNPSPSSALPLATSVASSTTSPRDRAAVLPATHPWKKVDSGQTKWNQRADTRSAQDLASNTVDYSGGSQPSRLPHQVAPAKSTGEGESNEGATAEGVSNPEVSHIARASGNPPSWKAGWDEAWQLKYNQRHLVLEKEKIQGQLKQQEQLQLQRRAKPENIKHLQAPSPSHSQPQMQKQQRQQPRLSSPCLSGGSEDSFDKKQQEHQHRRQGPRDEQPHELHHGNNQQHLAGKKRGSKKCAEKNDVQRGRELGDDPGESTEAFGALGNQVTGRERPNKKQKPASTLIALKSGHGVSGRYYRVHSIEDHFELTVNTLFSLVRFGLSRNTTGLPYCYLPLWRWVGPLLLQAMKVRCLNHLG